MAGTIRTLRTLIEGLDTPLDAIPTLEDGRWYRYGGWGCRLRLPRVGANAGSLSAPLIGEPRAACASRPLEASPRRCGHPGGGVAVSVPQALSPNIPGPPLLSLDETTAPARR